MKIVRTVIPVGQGAFYMENIMQGADECNILYDCGSIQHSTLTKCIKSDIPRNLRFDIFFISHFDYDHVNGINDLIKHGCTFNRVVVPLIDESDNWYYIASQGTSEASNFIKSLIKNPSSVFNKETTIVAVKAIESERKGSDELINLNELGPKIDSGTKIGISSSFSKWCYVPFNFDEQQRRTDLWMELTKSGLDVSKLNDVCYIDANRSLIKAAYQNVHEDGSNKTSLIVYSGPSNNSYANIRIHQGLIRCKCYDCGCRHYFFKFAGCLYLGDTDLNQSIKGGKNIIDELYSHLASLRDHIGLLQIPHHGSRLSYNNKILNINSKNPPFCFVSYGHNQHGHPSLRVVADILTNDSALHCVTEDRNTALIQLINIQ